MSIPITTELLDGCVLSLLSQQDYYGYTLTQKVQEFSPISESTMYPVLRRLKKENWLETYDEAFQGRNRRYYKITDSGLERLIEIKNDWQAHKRVLDNILGGKNNEIHR